MNRQFGALSGLAMVLVVLNHAIELGMAYPERLGVSPLPQWAQSLFLSVQGLGVFAVPTFLFISGSFLAYAAQGEPPRVTGKFLLSSLRYILVPYVLWSLMFYLVIYLHWGESFSPLGYAKNLAVGYPFHFVPLLVFFYILSPLWIALGRRIPNLFMAAVAAYQLVLIMLVNPGMLGVTLPGWMGILKLPALGQTMSEWAVFVPLGIVYGLNARRLLPLLKKFASWLGILTMLLFTLAILNGLQVIHFPLARYLAMVAFVLLLPALHREQIPALKFLERVGRRSYGLYLTHLICMDLFFVLLQILPAAVLGWPLALMISLCLVGLAAPIYLMEALARGPARQVYRYLFG